MQLFDEFIRVKAVDADRLFILGDLFEYWLGDDASRHSGYQPVVDSLASLSGKTKVYIMHGNRDFLIGDAFAASVDGELLPDPTKISLGGSNVLLMHGDSLCTDDVEHQKFRELSRSDAWQREILSKSISEREAIASQLRMNSTKGNAEKSQEIMDVNQQAVISTMQEQMVQLLVHGHTHRMAIHDFDIEGQPAHRIVLGDWHSTGNFLIHDSEGFRLVNFPQETLVASLGTSALEEVSVAAHQA
jgi:UDP-2,3-diacylglucosamine hydrolase